MTGNCLVHVQNALRGMAIGAADLVPGVSGGTVALLLGIYPRFIAALSHLGPQTMVDFVKEPLPVWWGKYDGAFLTAIVIGAAVSILALSSAFHWALENQPQAFYAFFLGLMLASAWHLLRVHAQRLWRWWFFFLLAVVFSLGLASVRTLGLELDPWMLFVSGMCAMAVMLLPGISGSMMLVILGTYQGIIVALASLQVVTLLPFVAGALLGVMVFSRLITLFFQRFQHTIMAIFSGFMLGALPRLWPWRLDDHLVLPQPDAVGFIPWIVLAGMVCVLLPLQILGTKS